MPRDVYVSLDVETDGPIPGPTGWGFSMLSLGACIAGVMDDTGFQPIAPDRSTFYVELQPISDDVNAEALAVCEQGLSMPRSALVHHGTPPTVAMRDFVRWVEAAERDHRGRAVAVSWPSSWDFGTWVFWYLMRFAGRSPFSHGQHRDIRDLAADRLQVPIRGLTKHRLPAELRTKRRHTHNALADALEQAELFTRVMTRRDR